MMVPALIAAMVEGFNDELDMMAAECVGLKSAWWRRRLGGTPWKWRRDGGGA